MIRKPEFHVDLNFWTFIYVIQVWRNFLIFHDITAFEWRRFWYISR